MGWREDENRARAYRRALRQSIIEKMSPVNLKGYSPRMYALLGAVLGTKYRSLQHSWSAPPFEEIAITDGRVRARRCGDYGMNEYIGAKEDFVRNLGQCCTDAHLEEKEVIEFINLCRQNAHVAVVPVND
jgi:hypothetical protein